MIIVIKHKDDMHNNFITKCTLLVLSTLHDTRWVKHMKPIFANKTLDMQRTSHLAIMSVIEKP